MNIISAIFLSRISNAPLSLYELREVRKANMPLKPYVNAIIVLYKTGITYDREVLRAHYLQGVDIQNVAYGLVLAKKAGTHLSLSEAIKNIERK